MNSLWHIAWALKAVSIHVKHLVIVHFLRRGRVISLILNSLLIKPNTIHERLLIKSRIHDLFVAQRSKYSNLLLIFYVLPFHQLGDHLGINHKFKRFRIDFVLGEAVREKLVKIAKSGLNFFSSFYKVSFPPSTFLEKRNTVRFESGLNVSCYFLKLDHPLVYLVHPFFYFGLHS